MTDLAMLGAAFCNITYAYLFFIKPSCCLFATCRNYLFANIFLKLTFIQTHFCFHVRYGQSWSGIISLPFIMDNAPQIQTAHKNGHHLPILWLIWPLYVLNMKLALYWIRPPVHQRHYVLPRLAADFQDLKQNTYCLVLLTRDAGDST